MKTDIYEKVTAKIIAELETGAVPWLKPWKNGRNAAGNISIRPCNAESNRPYTGINVLLLWCAAQENGFTSNGWLTLKQILKLKGRVRYEEFRKSTKIVFMKPYVKVVSNPAGEDEEQTKLVAREYSVYNVEQCDGLKLPAKSIVKEVVVEKPVDIHKRREDIQAWVEATGAVIRYGGDRAFYTTREDYVQLPHVAQFETAEHYHATELHELIHWTGSEKRLNRVFGKRFGDNAYATEELVAELGSAFLCADHNIEGQLRHAGYIESWLKALKADKRIIFSAASAATKAAEFLHSFSQKAEAQPEVELEEAA
jgi:antirestriction protein ArdC